MKSRKPIEHPRVCPVADKCVRHERIGCLHYRLHSRRATCSEYGSYCHKCRSVIRDTMVVVMWEQPVDEP